MATNFLHPSYADRIDIRRPEPVQDPPDSLHPQPVSLRALRTADRACCCPAKPAVMALMTAAPHRPHQIELLFCAHHYRSARIGLAAAGRRWWMKPVSCLAPQTAGRTRLPPAGLSAIEEVAA
jgi:hypothetical protein